MTFTSVYFLVFVVALLIVYYCVPKKAQWGVLLAASYAFYLIVSYKYAAFMVITTLTTFFAALKIEKIADASKALLIENRDKWTPQQRKEHKLGTKKKQKLWLAGILVFNFGILFVLKYMNFLSGSLNSLVETLGGSAIIPQFKFVLPLGISFYTFQSMGYAIDVFRGKVKAQHNPAKFALFVSFFPQIVQGPISFYGELAPQLYEQHSLDYENIKYGAQLVMWGFFKKLVVADRAVKIVSMVSEDYELFTGASILLAILTYSIQLYADFSGGIDITRGVSQMLGIKLAENFRQPYFSQSISEYWRRWHITLGAWVKEYVFYPLAMSKPFLAMGKKLKKSCGRHIGKVLPTCIASLITFIIIGMWHGANWKFFAFGLWNGLVITVSTLLEPVYERVKLKLKIKTECLSYRLFCMARTYVVIVIGLVFDIAPSFKGALSMMLRAVTDIKPSYFGNNGIYNTFFVYGLDKNDYIVIVFGILVMLAVSIIREKSTESLRVTIDRQNVWFQWALMFACILATILVGSYGPGYTAADFVYMQF